MQIFNPSASFTRPNNITAYAAGQTVANSTTAGSVVPMSFTLGNTFGPGALRLTRARIVKSGTSNTNATFRIHLFQALPTVAAGDGALFSTSGAADWLGNIDVSSMIAFTDGCNGTGSFPAGSEGFIRLKAGATIYGILAALGAYTPVANEVFTVILEEVDSY